MSKKISYQSQRDCLHVCLILIILFSFAYYEAERKNSVSPPEENQITTTDSITPSRFVNKINNPIQLINRIPTIPAPVLKSKSAKVDK